MQPLVEIEGDRVGAFDTGDAFAQARRELSHRAERAIDVKPQPLVAREIGEFVEVIDTAGARAARGRDDDEGLLARGTVVRDERTQPLRAQFRADLHGPHPQRLFAETSDIEPAR